MVLGEKTSLQAWIKEKPTTKIPSNIAYPQTQKWDKWDTLDYKDAIHVEPESTKFPILSRCWEKAQLKLGEKKKPTKTTSNVASPKTLKWARMKDI